MNIRKSQSQHVVLVGLLALLISFSLSGFVWGQKESVSKVTSVEGLLNYPCSITKNGTGKIIFVDSFNNRIGKIEGNNAKSLAGSLENKDNWGNPLGEYVDGSISKARFNKPRGVAVDSKDNIFVADTDNHVIRKITGDKVYTFSGTGQPGYKDGQSSKAQFNNPSNIVIDKNDNVYVTDTLNNIIRRITPQGQVTTFAGKIEGGFKDSSSSGALFNEPSGIDIDAKGNLYVLDSGNQLIRKISQGQVSTIAGTKGGNIPGTAYAQGS